MEKITGNHSTNIPKKVWKSTDNIEKETVERHGCLWNLKNASKLAETFNINLLLLIKQLYHSFHKLIVIININEILFSEKLFKFKINLYPNFKHLYQIVFLFFIQVFLTILILSYIFTLLFLSSKIGKHCEMPFLIIIFFKVDSKMLVNTNWVVL